MHDYLVIIEGVTIISWIFVVFAWFNALIEIGRYTIYPPLVHTLVCHIDQQIWHKDIPLKVSIFVWRILENRLPTKDILCRCGVLLDEDSPCVCGCGGVKSVHHLFLNCNIFGSLWYLFHDWVGVLSVDPNSIVDNFHHYAYLSGSPKKP